MNRYVLIGVVILAIIGILFWFFWPKSREKIPETPVRFAQSPPAASYEVEPRKSSFRFFDTFAPVVAPFEELLSHNPSQPPLTLRGGDDNISPLKLRETKEVMKKPLTEQEIFNWVWPEDYRRGLAEIETLYINAGYIAKRPPTDFNDEKNIYTFLAGTLDVAETQKWIVPSDAKILRKGLKETLPLVIEHDKNLLRQGLLPTSFLPKDMGITKLRWVILANIAQASPGWVTSGDCYKDDAPFNPLPGPNIWAECCNCGLFCVGYYCKFVDDCGVEFNSKNSCQTKKCNVPLGCLNLTCCTFPNAIWDPLPGTGICGCG